MKKPTLEDLLEKIEALEKRVEALEKTRGGSARASRSSASSAATSPSSATDGATEMTLVVLAEGRAWRSGTGHFYFSKKDGTDDCGSVGIALAKLGGTPLAKGTKIHITTSKVEDDNFRGEQRFQCFADTCEILDNEKSAPAASGDDEPPDDFVPEEPAPSAEPEDDIPF